MKEKVDRWLDEHPDGEVRFSRLGVESRCALAVSMQDCYFGVGVTAETAFDNAHAIFQSYDEHLC